MSTCFEDIIFLGDTVPSVELDNEIRGNPSVCYVINLECCFDFFSSRLEKDINLSMDAKKIKFLMHDNLVCCLANNHVLDAGSRSFEEMLKHFEANNVKYCGTNKQKFIQLEVRGSEVIIYNSCERGFRINKKVNYLSYNEIKSHSRRYPNTIHVIHWGYDAEFCDFPSIKQLMLACIMSLCTPPQTIIVGHHSHTVMPRAEINKRKFFFSIGNSQFFPLPGSGTTMKYNDLETVIFDKFRCKYIAGYLRDYRYKFLPQQLSSIIKRIRSRPSKFYLLAYFLMPYTIITLFLILVKGVRK